MGDFDKNAKCNKLLRKAVQVGDIDLVELILAIAADRGIAIIILKYCVQYTLHLNMHALAPHS